MNNEHIDYDEAIECLRAIKSAYFPNGSSKWTSTISLCIKLIEKEKKRTFKHLGLRERNSAK